MACTMFTATFSASQEITRTFDIIWAIEAGLWNLRVAAKNFFEENPNADKKTAKEFLVKGLNVHGLNAKRIANELTWEYEEQYVAELLLTYGIGIFDSWVDGIVDTVLIHSSNNLKKKLKEDLKKGEFQTFENALSQEPLSALAGCFHVSPKRQDQHIDNLRLVYKYLRNQTCYFISPLEIFSISSRTFEPCAKPSEYTNLISGVSLNRMRFPTSYLTLPVFFSIISLSFSICSLVPKTL